MIIVHVQHFLNNLGQGYFPIWAEKVGEKLQNYKGFISLCVLELPEAPEECHLQLRFENEDLLKKWAQSEDHDALIRKLKPYRNRKQASMIFRKKKEFTSVSQ